MSRDPLDRYLPPSIRSRIEEAYYARINEQARLEHVMGNPDFWRDPDAHPAMYADHGVVHVRDVAAQVLHILEKINGVLIPPRPPDRLHNFMFGYGVLLAYLHDIGMVDVSEFGRKMHPQFAAQAVFSPELDPVVQLMWSSNCGALPERLSGLFDARVLTQPPQLVFRELLSLSIGHSKSNVPVTTLNDPPTLRALMLDVLSHDLEFLYLRKQLSTGKLSGQVNSAVKRPLFLSQYYSDFENEAFDWLISPHPQARQLVGDVVDTLRALRCADALRQRGAVQKTSAGYQVFLSQRSGYPTYALRLGDDRLYLLEIESPLSGGEANIASSEFTGRGDLRISFQRGAFDSDEALQRAVSASAYTINDFLVDIVGSFQLNPADSDASVKTSGQIQVQLESTGDNPHFVELVQQQLRQRNPALAPQVYIVPSLQDASPTERERYLAAPDLDWDDHKKLHALRQLERSGQKIQGLDLQRPFEHLKLIHLDQGETLLEAGTPSAFVYIPLTEGLQGCPLGGYDSFTVPAWMPLGNTGVIRGAPRNADVVALRPLPLLVIPKDLYLRHWYDPYTPDELKKLLAGDLMQ